MSNGVDNFLDAAGKLVKVVPTAYVDLLQPAVKETGVIISKLPKAINAALIGVDCWVEEKKYKLDETKKLLEHKLQNVDPEKIVPPEQYVAIPALQSMSYSMDSEELRNLYTNLLSKAMNIDTKDSVHPAFIEIIKQLSPLDARLLECFSDSPQLPIARYIATLYDNTTIVLKNNILSPGSVESFDEDFQNGCSINNLIRLGLLEIDYDYRIGDYLEDLLLTDDYLYSSISSILDNDLDISEFNYPQNLICDLDEITNLTIEEGTIKLSYLGELFVHICLN